MRHFKTGRHFSRDTAHRLAMYRNLVTDLLRHGKIVTTEAKAKEIRGFAEHIITLAKEGSLHSRRQALAFVYDENVVKQVFDELSKKYAERPGGYTRILKLGPRLGDNAHMAQIELV